MRNLDENLIENNLARDNGREGFRVFSDSDTNTFNKNKSIGNDQDGFNIFVADSTLTMIKNTARKNFEDGFDIDIDTDKVTMTGNRAIGNANSGIENNGGADTALKDNIMKGNGIDLAGRGDDTDGGASCDGDANVAATDDGGNVFATGTFDTCVPDGSDD